MEVLLLAALCLLNVPGPGIRGAHNASRSLSNPELFSGFPNVTLGSTATIHCLFKNASLPVTFMLFRNRSSRGRMTVSEDVEATFNVTIYNHTSLGPYKCKVNNSATHGLYSKDFTFLLQEHTAHGPGPTGESGGGWVHLAWIIPLLVLGIIIVAFMFWRISKPAAKDEAIQEDTTYQNVSARETGRRRRRRRRRRRCSTVQ
ncbi:unnamed protein product [Staurois parvus]|uniref:Ig-like domain-containing protein n=1 Tax=Staurois parvus TaxID=386267 RepID=A0ABN9FG77_9NEOB|nr:unnamed protein product [Staurois parvus]